MADDEPATIDEAEEAGWTWLSTHCGACGAETDLAWDLLRGRSPTRVIADIISGLKCEPCGAPAPSVCLKQHKIVPGFDEPIGIYVWLRSDLMEHGPKGA